MKKITITTTSFADYDKKPIEILKENGFEVVLNTLGRKLKKNEVIELCKGSVGIIAGTETIDADILNSLVVSTTSRSLLKVISRCGAGLDNVDLDASKKLGIKVFNTPDAPTLAVGELTVGLILDLLHKVSQMDREVREGQWQKRMGNLLSEKKVGIIGFGRIGQKVAALLTPFDCEIRYYDVKAEGKEKITESLARRIELEELLKTSDIISIHVSSKEQIIGVGEIEQMKKGSWLVNVSRGTVIDEDALFEALKNGHLAGAALDVFKEEPYYGPLREFDNVILTPHIGSYAIESRIKMELAAVENLLNGLKVVV